MEIAKILEENKFRFKKSLGQNFITDKNLLNAICIDANITKDDIVVEIGSGAGTLTAALAQNAKEVYTFEVDRDLENILKETLKEYDNVKVSFLDVLKIKDEDFKKIVNRPFKVVANLPYYITSPLIMRFLESDLDCLSITIMIQKEVADRLIAKPNTANYGAITCAISLIGDTEITRIVSKRLFYPVPKVDSAVINIKINRNKYAIKNFKLAKKVIKSAFLMRRKTFTNNLSSMFGISKETAKEILGECGYDGNIRGEALSVEDFIKIADILETKIINLK